MAENELLPEAPDHSRGELLKLAAYAPHAGFLLVEMSGGALQPERIEVFARRLETNTDPLIAVMLASTSGDVEATVTELLQKQALIVGALAAAGQLFRTEPGGGEARAEFMRLVGSGSSPEATAAAVKVGRILDGKPPTGLLWAAGGAVFAIMALPIALLAAGLWWWLG